MKNVTMHSGPMRIGLYAVALLELVFACQSEVRYLGFLGINLTEVVPVLLIFFVSGCVIVIMILAGQGKLKTTPVAAAVLFIIIRDVFGFVENGNNYSTDVLRVLQIVSCFGVALIWFSGRELRRD
jgi:hypothetical protein